MFQFKQFQIQQKLSAAKVGTDGVLLGAWINVDFQPKNILDIGSGTGLIALMMAQRFPFSFITAIEKEINAYQESLLNIHNSPWKNRLKVYHKAFQDFETRKKFDLIVSNPPFYKEDYLSHNPARNMARNGMHLPIHTLLSKSKAILSPQGVIAVVLPYQLEEEFLMKAKMFCLFPNSVCRVRGNSKSPIKRSLIQLSTTLRPTQYSKLIIENKRHEYTEEYTNLTKEFYLHM